MSNQAKLLLVAVVLVVFCSACTKLPQGQSPKAGNVAVIKLPQTNSIPSSWGKLISAVIPADSPEWTQLWFQDEKGDLRLAFFNTKQKVLGLFGRLIPRD